MRKIPGRNGGTLTIAEKGDVLNPKGRDRKLVNDIIYEMQQAGVKPVKPLDIIAAFESLLNSSIEELKDIKANENAPYFLRRVAGEMLTNKGYEIIERMIDRAHGKPKQQTDITSAGEKIGFNLPQIIIE